MPQGNFLGFRIRTPEEREANTQRLLDTIGKKPLNIVRGLSAAFFGDPVTAVQQFGIALAPLLRTTSAHRTRFIQLTDPRTTMSRRNTFKRRRKRRSLKFTSLSGGRRVIATQRRKQRGVERRIRLLEQGLRDLAPEVKKLTRKLQNETPSAETAKLIYISNTKIGAEDNERIGRKITCKSLQWQVHFVSTAEATVKQIVMMRHVIFIDTESAGIAPTKAQFFQTPTGLDLVTSFYAAETSPRFIVLLDKVYSNAPGLTTDTSTNGNGTNVLDGGEIGLAGLDIFYILGTIGQGNAGPNALYAWTLRGDDDTSPSMQVGYRLKYTG